MQEVIRRLEEIKSTAHLQHAFMAFIKRRDDWLKDVKIADERIKFRVHPRQWDEDDICKWFLEMINAKEHGEDLTFMK